MLFWNNAYIYIYLTLKKWSNMQIYLSNSCLTFKVWTIHVHEELSFQKQVMYVESILLLQAHTNTHMHTYTYTQKHTHTHTNTHTQACTLIQNTHMHRVSGMKKTKKLYKTILTVNYNNSNQEHIVQSLHYKSNVKYWDGSSY